MKARLCDFQLYSLRNYCALSMEEKKKQLPYGVSDFVKVRCEEYYYVDKTIYLRKLEEFNYILFLRPRRFGKSLFVNMLKTYYDINRADRFEELFGDLEIGKNPTPSHNKYLMLSFNFSEVDSVASRVQESFNSAALDSIKAFIGNYSTLLGADAYRRVVDETSNCAEALRVLSMVVKRMGQKMYVTIDEYDNFANTLMSVDELGYHKILHDGFVRYFCNVLKVATTDNNAAIDKIFITGVSPLCLSDVTSGFNIARNISMNPAFNNMVGFTETEVRQMMVHFMEDDELLPLAKAYYDNYSFSRIAVERGEHVFNSDMVLYFIGSCMAEGRPPKNVVDTNAKSDYSKLQSLSQRVDTFEEKSGIIQTILNDGYVLADVKPEFQVEELSDVQNFVSMLFYLGLLTCGKSPDGMDALTVANEAMRQQYGQYMSTCYAKSIHWRTDVLRMGRLWADWGVRGQWKPLITYIASVMHDNDSVRDFGPDGEQFVKGFMLAHLCNGSGYIVRTEAEMGHGYSDIYLYPVATEYRHALVLEIKYLKPTASDKDVEAKVTEAKNQLRKYMTDKRLHNEAETKGWSLVAAVAVFRGWNAEMVEEI